MRLTLTLTSLIGTGTLAVALGPAQAQDPDPALPPVGDVPDLDIPMQEVEELPGDEAVRVTWLPTSMVDPGADDPRAVTEAVAVLHPTRGNDVRGTVRFRESERGLEVVASVEGLPAGEHAYHVHVFGDCSSADATSAGPHFHFAGSSFDRSAKIITGNLGELRGRGGKSDRTIHETRIPGATLQGNFSILGRAVVVHARGNDPSQPPDGGAGERLACGVIGVDGDPPGAQQTATR